MALVLIILIYSKNDQNGGSREAIFSRFEYAPEFPFISQFDMTNLDRFSKIYNIPGPIKFISGRPYKYYRTNESTWLYPWDFPQEVNHSCIRQASMRCHEPIILVKKEEAKLSGLSAQTPKDIVQPSSCFSQLYEQCIQQRPS